MKQTFALFCVLTIVTSCNCDFNMVTTIDKSGALTRCFICPADSALLCGNTQRETKLPITITDDWSLSWNTNVNPVRHNWPMTPDEYSSCIDTISLFVERRFSSAEEMSSEFQFDAVPIKPHSRLEKKFKWFYTDYTFCETFPQPEFSIPVSDYLTREEALFWFTGNPIIAQSPSGSVMFENLSEIAQSVNKWFCANSLADAFQCIVDNYEDIQGTGIPKEDFVGEKDRFIRQMTKEGYNLSEFSKEDAFNQYFRTNAYSEFIKENSNSLADSWWLNMNFTFTYSVVLPGKPIPSSGATINGNAQIFNLNLGMIYPGDYNVTAKSRSYNLWACILSIVVLLISSVSLAFHNLVTAKDRMCRNR